MISLIVRQILFEEATIHPTIPECRGKRNERPFIELSPLLQRMVNLELNRKSKGLLPGPRDHLWHRTRILVSGLFASMVLFSPARAEIPASATWPAVKVIDVHTHVFNARDLPLIGILNALGAPRPVAVVVAEALLLSMPDEEAAPNLEAIADRVEHPKIRELSSLQRNILGEFVETSRLDLLRQVATYLKVEPDVTLVAETMAKVGLPADDNLPQWARIQELTVAKDLGEVLKGYVRFIGVMIMNHEEIVALLKSSYPNTDLFVHHMMDMEVAYDDKPMTPFPDQIRAMKKLDAAFPGELMHFVAFDPFRRTSALTWATKAVTDDGAVGLKIYPPSGYRAADNEKYSFPPKPGWFEIWGKQRWKARYGNWTEDALDKTLEGAYQWAATNCVPILTHCTPHGFEADKDYGLMADPFFWAEALSKKENANLALCFGHAGGEAYWFSDPADDAKQNAKPPGDPWQFGNQVVEMCLTYPNVYCEVGYLDPILDPRKMDLLVRRLEAIIERPSMDGTWRLGSKIMFGTDWHMLYKEAGYEEYLAKWDEVIKRVANGAWRQAFFGGNAKKSLRLADLAQDSRFTPDERKRWAELSAAIK